MARTQFFASLRRAYALALVSGASDGPSVRESVEMAQDAWTRRRFLKTAAVTTALVGTGCASIERRPPRRDPGRVAIVGGGMAGLSAARTLKNAGAKFQIYEASKRTGGRMWTARDLMGPGLTTELGGEFIDSMHTDILDFVKEFELELIDTEAAEEAVLIRDAFFFNGRHYSLADMIEAFQPVATRIRVDMERAGDPSYRDANPTATTLDRMSLSTYLDSIGASGALREMLDVAYVTEYGLDADDQSALNIIYLIGTEPGTLELFGESDERYKVRGGNDQLVQRLAAEVSDCIHLEHRLEAVSRPGDHYVLTFAGPNGSPMEVKADTVIMTIPFTLLRDVQLEVPMPPAKRLAIDTLGYGTNAKVFMGCRTRPWRAHGYAGFAFSDEPFQLCWDNAQQQPGEAGGITLFSGGHAAKAAGEGTADEFVARMLPSLEKVFPGTTAAFTGVTSRFHWPTYPFTKGSYACYRPGQWTTVAGAEGESVGRMYFAGEHCSAEFQGFMNGAAETGRKAAEAVLGLRAKVAG